MAQLTFNIVRPADVQDFIDMTKWKFPIPQIPDPNWVNPGDGGNPPMVNQFTDIQWVKEGWRREFKLQIKRYKDFKEKEAVNNIVDDDSIT